MVLSQPRTKLDEDWFLDPSCVLYLPLYKLDGAKFRSADQYGHLCSAHGNHWTPEGHSFDGVDDYINCGNSKAFDITEGITIETWLKFLVQSPTIFQSPLTKLNAYDILFRYEAGIELAPQFEYYDGAAWEYLYSSTRLYWKNWYFVVGLWDGQNVQLQVNNINQIGTSTNPATNKIATSTGSLKIGTDDGGTRWFKGIIGELRLYNRALTAQERIDHYIRGRMGRYL